MCWPQPRAFSAASASAWRSEPALATVTYMHRHAEMFAAKEGRKEGFGECARVDMPYHCPYCQGGKHSGRIRSRPPQQAWKGGQSWTGGGVVVDRLWWAQDVPRSGAPWRPPPAPPGRARAAPPPRPPRRSPPAAASPPAHNSRPRRRQQTTTGGRNELICLCGHRPVHKQARHLESTLRRLPAGCFLPQEALSPGAGLFVGLGAALSLFGAAQAGGVARVHVLECALMQVV